MNMEMAMERKVAMEMEIEAAMEMGREMEMVIFGARKANWEVVFGAPKAS